MRSMILLTVAVLVAGGLSGAFACGDCADEGCESSARVTYPRLDFKEGKQLTARVCVDGVCKDERITNGAVTADHTIAVTLRVSGNDGSTQPATFTIIDRQGRTVYDADGVVRLAVNEPGGDGCGDCVIARGDATDNRQIRPVDSS